MRLRSRASTAGSSTSWRPHSSCRAGRSSRQRTRVCRAGRIISLLGWRNPRAMRRTSSTFRPGVWWRSAPKSRSKVTIRYAMVHDLTTADVARGITEGKMLLVDVREPREIEAERIADSLYLPMSVYDPQQIPDPEGKTVVFICASGIRSVTASEIAQAAGLPYDA